VQIDARRELALTGLRIRQVLVERKPLPKLSVPGKTTAAINNQRRRLKEAGLLKNSFTGLRHVPWTICELRQLARLTGEHGFSAAFIAQLQLIPGRSQHAISKMMGRHGLGNPAIKSRARNARRLTPEIRRELEPHEHTGPPGTLRCSRH
jgi:hypothetical protein